MENCREYKEANVSPRKKSRVDYALRYVIRSFDYYISFVNFKASTFYLVTFYSVFCRPQKRRCLFRVYNNTTFYNTNVVYNTRNRESTRVKDSKRKKEEKVEIRFVSITSKFAIRPRPICPIHTHIYIYIHIYISIGYRVELGRYVEITVCLRRTFGTIVLKGVGSKERAYLG